MTILFRLFIIFLPKIFHFSHQPRRLCTPLASEHTSALPRLGPGDGAPRAVKLYPDATVSADQMPAGFSFPPCCLDRVDQSSRSSVVLKRLFFHLVFPMGEMSLITSPLDYCNSLINNIAKQDLSKLQRVKNCLARFILRAPRFSPSLPMLKQLHWLLVNYRIKFKLSTLTYRDLAIHQPPYLASLLHFSNVPRQLRSSTSQQHSIPRTKLNLGKRALSVAAPIIWNELPTTLKSCESLASFRKNLKTYLFKIAFPP